MTLSHCKGVANDSNETALQPGDPRLIELGDICKTYQVGDMPLPVLKGITLNINAGEFVALMGSSGSGKTTLMNLLGSLDRSTAGLYKFSEIDVSGLSSSELAVFRNRHVGFVFQNFNLLPRTSALDNVLLPTLYATDDRTQSERVAYAKHLLSIVGLAGRMDHAPNQLSGGERQRVAIARALINRPQLLLADEPTGNLDSKTEQEILELFRKLNLEHRITLIVVTHDAEVARSADRVVHMKDGVIANDHTHSVQTPIVNTKPASKEPLSLDSRATGQVLASILNAVTVSLAALRTNALRTALTMLGVIIGVASVVNVMELSSGSSRAIRDTVASMGANMLNVSSTYTPSSGRRRRYVPLTPDDVSLLLEQCPAVRLTAPIVHGQVQLVYGNRRCRPTFVLGSSPDYLRGRTWSEMDMGQLFSEEAVYDALKVCIIGQTVAKELFSDEYPIGKEIRANGVSLRVVGVLSAKGGDVIGNDQDDIMVAPWTTFKYRLNSSTSSVNRVAAFGDQMPKMQLASLRRSTRNEHLSQIYVQALSPEDVPEARQQIRQALSRRHDVDPDVFQIQDITEVSRVTKQVVAGLSALGLIIAGVSLLVGGVGIMNIMLVSVTERTREIGLRMAVGANRNAILRQFLIEATVLCLIGGLFGIVLGHVSSMTIGWMMGWPSEMSFWAPIIAVGVAATVGIVFGYYPARKASMLDPIDALRYE
ncbi:ABC transporter permease [Novipirellula artificiosorum]|uniref:Macrolide export ATP-binding/permease protein MacB n=1 Tax=Novipirellula artificiosorum TaxID=2528016 RepID=A0A5C6D5A3_9BACT|nr:ABC transporter permease [Novipirellula artificiosorum]TWU31978.1 Macrolide export ATP-binding/permease protein MacB [Novipirellula artificiosorum]